jgi:primosomal protein N' (replication factor Y)
MAMYVVSVVPIARGIFREHLSYFSSEKLERGTIVFIPIRGRGMHALVLESDLVSTKKTDIRQASFGLKKITASHEHTLCAPLFIKTIMRIAKETVSLPGHVLASLVPKIILEGSLKINPESKKRKEKRDRLTVEVIQAEDQERFATYRSVVRESFSRSESVFIIIPSALVAELLRDSLLRGIKEYIFVFHGKEKKSVFRDNWQKAVYEPHPVVILGTSQILALFRSDLGTIILDRESSSNYYTRSRPYLDIRTMALMYAEELQARIIFGDLSLRTETVYERERNHYQSLGAVKYRLLADNEMEVIDMRPYNKKELGFRAISEKLQGEIEESISRGGHVALFSLRRGFAPHTVCDDCGNALTCTHCNSPLTLTKDKNKEALFTCRLCNQISSAETTCSYCGSWKLTALGVGIERAAKEIKTFFPETPLFRLDSDSTPSQKEALHTINTFLKTPGAILLGTEMIFFYLRQKVTMSAVITADALLAMPNFRADERLFSILLRLRLLAKEKTFIQTRLPESPLFEYLRFGDLLSFYREELINRKRYNLPPFARLITVGKKGNKETVWKELTDIGKKLPESTWHAVVPVSLSKETEGETARLVIKIKGEKIPDEIYTLLRRLPPSFLIIVDPENIL